MMNGFVFMEAKPLRCFHECLFLLAGGIGGILQCALVGFFVLFAAEIDHERNDNRGEHQRDDKQGAEEFRLCDQRDNSQTDQLAPGQPFLAVFFLLPNHALHLQIAAEDFQGVENAVDMAALIAVAGIDARTDEAVADVRATLEDKGIQVIVVDEPNE